MRYHFKIHTEGRGYWAKCVELEGCFTQGNTKQELYENMQEALNLYIQEPEDSLFLASLPKKSFRGKNIETVLVDPEIAFGFMMRYHWLKSKIKSDF